MGKFSMKTLNLRKRPTDKAKEPNPGGSDQQNLGYKKLKNRKTYRTVGLNFCITKIGNTKVQSNRTVSFSVFQFFEIF